MESQYYIKYMKYKAKYLKLQEQLGLARRHRKSQKRHPKKHRREYNDNYDDSYDNNNEDNYDVNNDDNNNDNNNDSYDDNNDDNYDDNNEDDRTYDNNQSDDKLAGLPKSVQKCLKQLNLSNFTDNPDVMNIIAQYLQGYLQQYGKDFISNPQNLKKIFKKLPKFI
jgi:hypothetical protein